MHPLEFEIHTGLPETCRRQAAELLFDTFSGKFAPVMGSRDQAFAILAESISPPMALVALCDDRLVGLAGVNYNGRGFMNLQRAPFVRELGWLRGLPGYLLARTYSHPADQGQLALECIAVADSLRGQGLGTQLLDAVFDLARAEHLTSIRLDVVDTNPRARELYERIGFVVTCTRRYPFLRPLLGLSAVTTMVKNV